MLAQVEIDYSSLIINRNIQRKLKLPPQFICPHTIFLLSIESLMSDYLKYYLS